MNMIIGFGLLKPETRSSIKKAFIPFRSTSLMQLIALVYKDQHVNKLERLLSDWLETSLSESSEDNESNTSPQVTSFLLQLTLLLTRPT